MIALLWKEYREKRLWVLMMTAGAAVIVARGSGYTFVSMGGLGALLDVWSDQCTIMMLVAYLFGAGTFASEIDRSAQFLFSQPVSWKKVLAAKLLAGVTVLTVSAVLAAIIYRLLCPEQYARFATVERLSFGVLWAVVLTGIPYLVGLVSSTVLPGVAGGALVGAVLMGAMGVNVALAARHNLDPDTLVISPVGWIVAPIVAMLVTARFGLTLQARDRIGRYSLIVLGVVGLGLISGPLHWGPDVAMRRLLNGSRPPCSYVGPDGVHAVMYRDSSCEFVGPGRARSTFTVEEWPWPVALFWPASNTIVYSPRVDQMQGRISASSDSAPRPATAPPDPVGEGWLTPDGKPGPLVVVRMDPSGRLVTRKIRTSLRLADPRVLVPSPNSKRYLVVPVKWGAGRAMPDSAWGLASIRKTGLVGVLDCEGACALRTLPVHASAIWWQSDTKIGWTDNGARRFLQVRNVVTRSKQIGNQDH
jgi:hypothetical protein